MHENFCFIFQLKKFKGYNQKKGFDYQETFNLVAKQTTVRVILALATINGWMLSQLEINNAFLMVSFRRCVYEITSGV